MAHDNEHVDVGARYSVVKLTRDHLGQQRLTEVGFLHIRETGQIGYLALHMFDEEYGVVRKDSLERFGPVEFLTNHGCGCKAKE